MMYKSIFTRNFLWVAVFFVFIFAGVGCNGAGSMKGITAKPHEQAYKLGIDALNHEKYDAAIEIFSEAIRLCPNYADAYFNIGLAYHSKKDYANAIESFNKSIELNPNDWRVYKSRGGVYYDYFLACIIKRDGSDKKEDSDRMFADFNKSIELNPNYADKPPKARATQRMDGGTDDDKLRLTAIITDTAITLGAKGGFMPSIFYKEFHRYVTEEKDLDTIIEYVPGEPLPRHPGSGRNLTVHERYWIYLYKTDEEGNIIKSMYTKSGEMLTDKDGNPVESVKAGDKVYALTNPRSLIVVKNLADFESKPLSAYDELKNRLMKIKERYSEAPDIDNIVIGVEHDMYYDRVIPIMYAARIAGYQNFLLALLLSEATEEKANGRLENHELVGGRSRASIQRVVLQNVAALRDAYNRRVREMPELEGKVTVKFAIDEFGKVIFAQVMESTMNDSELENTIVTRVKSWVFEQIDKPGDVTEVRYPFVFSQ